MRNALLTALLLDDPPADTEGLTMTPEAPICVHKIPIKDPCDHCDSLLIEEKRREQWIDGLVRMTEFFQNHPEFIPKHLGATISDRFHGKPADARSRVFDFIEAVGPVERETTYDPVSTKVVARAFRPHAVGIYVDNEAVGTNVLKPTYVWEWDESIFGREVPAYDE